MSFFRQRARTYPVLSLLLIIAVQFLPLVSSAEAESSESPLNKETLVTTQAAQSRGTNCLSGTGFGLTSADVSLLASLQQATANTAQISCHSKTGKVRFFGTELSHPVPAAPGFSATVAPEAIARNFLGTYGALFGLKSQANELKVMESLAGNSGTNFTRFQQVYQGIPVVAGEIIVQSNRSGQTLSAGGELLPDLKLSVTPSLSATQARDKALALVARDYKLPLSALNATTPELWIYDPRLLTENSNPFSKLVWRMEITPTSSADPIRELVLVDAQSGIVALHFNQIAEAKERHVCDQQGVVAAETPCTIPNSVRNEGGAATGNSDVDLAYTYAGITYDFYFNNFGRDSLDGAGLPLFSTVRFCPDSFNCPYANAYWSGSQMYYGTGYATADDVVGHELTHGFTQYTSHLFYYYQSGAINESMSDIFGEFIDQTDGVDGAGGNVRWMIGEDLPIGAIRSMKNPPAFGDPDRTGSPLYYGRDLDNGGVHFNSGVSNKAAYLMVDGTAGEPGGTFNGQTISGLGITKAAHIYYELETHLLTSGSDYQDMYDYLQQACKNLIGTFGITSADCQQVTKVVTATEMNITPTNAAAPEAPVCGTGKAPNNLFFDDMENTASGNWVKLAAATGTNTWYYPANPNPLSFDATYSTSGTNNLWGYDQFNIADYSIAMSNSITLPPGAFLHFRHAYDFDYGYDSVGNFYYYDGGIVEYSTDGGTNWNDARTLFTDNGYNATALDTNYGNPLGGRAAFGATSKGYYSSRANLNSLAGQNVRFRFRIASDNVLDDYGWFIDDFRIYTCIDASTTLLSSSLNPAVVGQSVTFTATVSAATGTPGGNVTFKDGAGTLGTAALDLSGQATLTTSTLTVGTHPVTAVYAGSSTYAASTSPGLNQVINPVGCNPLQVTVTSDGNSCGTLRFALATANNNPASPASGKTIDLSSFPVGTTFTIDRTHGGGVVLGTGITLIGRCSASPSRTPQIIIAGPGLYSDGLTLSGNNTISGILVKQFVGKQISARGLHNVLSCIKISRT